MYAYGSAIAEIDLSNQMLCLRFVEAHGENLMLLLSCRPVCIDGRSHGRRAGERGLVGGEVVGQDFVCSGLKLLLQVFLRTVTGRYILRELCTGRLERP